MFKKILIANRGEIACRVIETANRMGIATVAVYSDADRNSKFVSLADEAIYLGASESTESYLCIDKIVSAAKTCAVEAIHPGYGFLSENSIFAKRCEQEGITFIGPPISAIEAMGSKSEAKKIMATAGVPLVPGYHGSDQSEGNIEKESEKIGYPVLLKASAGGGGKGMRIVANAEEFSSAFNSAKREALSSFNDDTLLVEKYIQQPRHVEIQIFCDNHGKGVYLFERDCSIQRRHQKVIEEAPAPNLSDDVRKKMGEAALDCAKSISYTGAGTVEFLLDTDDTFYFMEMNTRLQVEHPVTEMITGLDLVEWQFRVANNEALPLRQDQLSFRGHSFEVRIYAEDPYQNFLPATGIVRHLSLPKESKHIRIDSGIREGDAISVYYDPMVAKLIVWDDNRQLAINRMLGALRAFKISGLPNNISFLSKIFENNEFIEAELSTNFIEKNEQLLLAPNEATQRTHLLAAINYVAFFLNNNATQNTNSDILKSPWQSSCSWRLNQKSIQSFTLGFNEQLLDYDLKYLSDPGLSGPHKEVIFELTNKTTNNTSHVILNKTAQHEPSTLTDCTATVDGHTFMFSVGNSAKEMDVFHDNHCWTYHIISHSPEEQTEHNENSLCAPMHGKIISLSTEVGKFVNKGDVLLIMEAMKMEHAIQAPKSGLVIACPHQPGDLVEEGVALIEIEEENQGG